MLTKMQQQQAQSLLPPCYSAEFDYCWDDANEHAPICASYAPIYALYHQDEKTVEDLVEKLPYCVPYCQPSPHAIIMPPAAATAAEAPPTYLGLTPAQIALGAGFFTAGVLVTLIARG